MRGLVATIVSLLSLTFASAAAADEPASNPGPSPGPKPAVTENWATARARALTEEGVAHRDAGSTDLAVTRLNEALTIDGTFEQAYLALASLRASRGEYDEAIVVLNLGLERVTGFDAGLVAKAEVFASAKRFREATSAYLAVLAVRRDDEAVLGRILAIAPRAALWPVALGASRRLAALARARGDAASEKDAKLTARALQTLLGDLDPVEGGKRSRDTVRRAIARATLR